MSVAQSPKPITPADADIQKVRPSGVGARGIGRKKGVGNKNTTLLKDAILLAASAAGAQFKKAEREKLLEDPELIGKLQDKTGLVAYLIIAATTEPKSFIPLLGKVLPLQITNSDGGPVSITIENIYAPRGEK